MKTILFVDDDPEIHALMEAMLDSPDRRLLHAYDAEAAMNKFIGENIDLVITDMVMPGYDGHDLLTAVVNEFVGIPVIIVTGQPSGDAAEACKATGALAYLTKPVDLEEFQNQVSTALKE